MTGNGLKNPERNFLPKKKKQIFNTEKTQTLQLMMLLLIQQVRIRFIVLWIKIFCYFLTPRQLNWHYWHYRKKEDVKDYTAKNKRKIILLIKQVSYLLYTLSGKKILSVFLLPIMFSFLQLLTQKLNKTLFLSQ